MLLYKYCPPDRLEPLRDYTFRVTPFNQLNDPFDCLPLISFAGHERAMKEFWLDHMFEIFLKHEGIGGKADIPFQKFLHQHEDLEEKFRERQNQPPSDDPWNFKASRSFQDQQSLHHELVCLSRNPASTLMWSHYAKNHCGYAIGIDPISLELPIPSGLP